ncbi:MAG TPA: hypothetical protein VFV87_18450, partial [Pirellulaceae bacterium]|nr:hypothetical protein [Pirellulaceae bacterium]
KKVLDVPLQDGVSIDGLDLSDDGAKLVVIQTTRNPLAALPRGLISIYDVSTGEKLIAKPQNSSWLRLPSFSHDGRLIAANVSRPNVGSKSVVILGADDGEELRECSGHADTVSGIAWNQAGTRLTTVSQDGILKFWDASTGLELMSLELQGQRPVPVEFSPDGLSIATIVDGNTISIWRAPVVNVPFPPN